MSKKMVRISTKNQEQQRQILKIIGDYLKIQINFFEGGLELKGYEDNMFMAFLLNKRVINNLPIQLDTVEVNNSQPKPQKIHTEKPIPIKSQKPEMQPKKIVTSQVKEEKPELKEIKNKVEQCFKKGWIMSKEEIVEITQAREADVECIIEELLKKQRIAKVGEDEYKKVESLLNIFEDDDYKAILDLIMLNQKFSARRLRQMLPKEESKINEVLKQLNNKYIQLLPDRLGEEYKVYLRGRILYFILQNGEVSKTELYKHFSDEEDASIERMIKFAQNKQELEVTKNGNYKVLKM